MELRQIRYFLALSRTLNFTRAAEECNVTQPTLTQSIKKLEEELGGALLLRQRNRTHLTHLGQTVLPYLQAVFDSSIAATMLADDISKGGRMPVRLGVCDAFDIDLLGEPMRELNASFAGLELHVLTENDSKLAELAFNGQIDLAIISRGAADETHFRFSPLYTETIKVAVSGRLPIAGIGDQVSFADLYALPCIGMRDSQVFQEIISSASKSGYRLVQGHWVQRLFEALVMVQAGLGYTFVGNRERLPDGARSLSISDEMPARTIGLAELRGKPSSPAVLALSALLRSKTYLPLH